MTPARIADIRRMVAHEEKRRAVMGGFESRYQIAINPSELTELLDVYERGTWSEAIAEAKAYINDMSPGTPISEIDWSDLER